MLRMLFCQ